LQYLVKKKNSNHQLGHSYEALTVVEGAVVDETNDVGGALTFTGVDPDGAEDVGVGNEASPVDLEVDFVPSEFVNPDETVEEGLRVPIGVGGANGGGSLGLNKENLTWFSDERRMAGLLFPESNALDTTPGEEEDVEVPIIDCDTNGSEGRCMNGGFNWFMDGLIVGCVLDSALLEYSRRVPGVETEVETEGVGDVCWEEFEFWLRGRHLPLTLS
jgi:hypothetical protein